MANQDEASIRESASEVVSAELRARRWRYIKAGAMLCRPGIALMLVIFSFAGWSAAGGQRAQVFDLVIATFGAIMVFAGGVALNDLCDEPIDEINIPKATQRPLLRGLVKPRDLLRYWVGFSAVGAVALAASLGWRGGYIALASVLLFAAYSMPPVRLSARGAIAPLLLPIGYVLLPMLVGFMSVGTAFTDRQLALFVSGYLMFAGRIALKDFRDEEGDRKYGKWTIVVTRGAGATCAFAAVLMASGLWVLLVRGVTTSSVRIAVAVAAAAMFVSLYGVARAKTLEARLNWVSGCALWGMTVVFATIIELEAARLDWSETRVRLGLVALGLCCVSAIRESRQRMARGVERVVA